MSEEEAFVQACSQGDMDTFHRLIRYKDNEEDNGLMRYKITPQTIDFKD